MKKLVLSFVIISFVLAGCKQTPKDEQNRQVTVQFTVNSTYSSFLKSTDEQDNQIDEIILLGAGITGEIVTIFPPITGAEITEGKTLTLDNDITALYAVANPTTPINPETVSELRSMTSDYSVEPAAPFVMTGFKSANREDITIDLERAIAKIEVTGENGFTVTSVKVKNTPDEGYVFPQGTLDVSSFGTTDYTISPYAPIYVAENTVDNPTTLTISGTYEGVDLDPIDVDFTVNGNLVPIERNKLYSVTIRMVIGTERDVNVKMEIKDWDTVEVDTQIIEID